MERAVFVYTTYPSIVEAEQAGRALVEREFAEPVIIAQTLALYAELLRETVGSR